MMHKIGVNDVVSVGGVVGHHQVLCLMRVGGWGV